MKLSLATLMLLSGTSATNNTSLGANDTNTTAMANNTTTADAQELYVQALINLHGVMPTNAQIDNAVSWKETYLGFAALLKNQYANYTAQSGQNLTNMDSETFNAFVKLQNELFQNQSLAVNGTNDTAPAVNNDDDGFSSLDDTQATEAQADEDAATNATTNTDGNFSSLDELTFMVDADHVITEAELLSLNHLKLAGEYFDGLPPYSMYSLSEGLYNRYNTWFPYDLEAQHDQYKTQAVHDIQRQTDAEVLSNYTTTKTAITDAKKALYDFIESTPPILALVNHDNWEKHYFPALCKKGAMPTLEEITTACGATNETIICEAATALADLTEEQHTEFNTKFNATLETFQPFMAPAHAMDESMNTIINGVFTTPEGRNSPIGQFSGALQIPIMHRSKLLAVYTAYNNLQTLSVVVEKAAAAHNDKHSTMDKLKDKAKAALDKLKANPWPFAIGLASIVIALGGCIYCKCAKKCCFAENKDDMEGGSSDRQVFKKQVKSKNSHKRHTKESLVPSFQVADEQA